MGMLRMSNKPPARSRSRHGRLEVPRFAHNAALHYLARANEYQLDETERRQLTEVVHGFTGRCDAVVADMARGDARPPRRHMNEVAAVTRRVIEGLVITARKLINH
jgi:hypothetical protein